MTEQVRVGVIGTGWYNDIMHLPALRDDPRATTVSICGRRREPAEEMAKKYDIPNVHTDYREMYENDNLDAVVIASPDYEHHPMTMAALDAGLHVMCEKPLASNAELAREMLARAEEVGVVHMTYFTHRWMPHLQHVQQLIDEGYIGKVFRRAFAFKPCRETVRGLVERPLGARRQGQQMEWPVAFVRWCPLGGLFEDRMGIGAADTE